MERVGGRGVFDSAGLGGCETKAKIRADGVSETRKMEHFLQC